MLPPKSLVSDARPNIFHLPHHPLILGKGENQLPAFRGHNH